MRGKRNAKSERLWKGGRMLSMRPNSRRPKLNLCKRRDTMNLKVKLCRRKSTWISSTIQCTRTNKIGLPN
jgi:hypothetical protein